MNCLLSVLKVTHGEISYSRKSSIAYPFLISSSMLQRFGHITRSVLLFDGLAITEQLQVRGTITIVYQRGLKRRRRV